VGQNTYTSLVVSFFGGAVTNVVELAYEPTVYVTWQDRAN